MVGGHHHSMDVNLRKLRETVEDRGACHAAIQGVARVGHHLVTQQQQSWVFTVAWAFLWLRGWGPLSSYGAQASHCSSFSCCKAWAQ